jgi:RNA polymerase sigma-70 factor, ECF subfamily
LSRETRVDRWLFAILRSIWLNEIRSRRIRERGGFVLKAIEGLPEAQREAILLVYGEGYSYAEAAAMLGVPIGTIMSRLAVGPAVLANLK